MLLRRYTNKDILAQVCLCNQRKIRMKTYCSQSAMTYKRVSLTNRSIIQVNGRDSSKLLQGLITNDLNLLNNEKSSFYSMLLNTNGRIVYDLILYRGKEENEFLIECDKIDDGNIIELMKKYKLRSKVYFEKRTDLDVSCLFNSNHENDDKLTNIPGFYKDSRLAQCGFRILDSSLLLSVDDLKLECVHLNDYIKHRYQIGITEGSKEVVNGIPLEHNLAWLNGVSFNKGCYIGQELVARTHHVGVIRKRIMPIVFSSDINENICGKSVVNEKEKSVGKVIGHSGNVGVGLLRLKEVDAATNLSVNVGNGFLSVSYVKPDWWPS